MLLDTISLSLSSTEERMKSALESGALNGPLIDIGEWLLNHSDDTAVCPVCGGIVKPKGELSTEVETHFAHERWANCPSTAKNAKPFDIFNRTPRGSAEDAKRLKLYALDNLESIYERSRHLCPGLTLKEFLPLLDLANKYDIWSFKNFVPGYLPYVLLCCADLFKSTQTRPQSMFFILEPSASGTDYWHIHSGLRRTVWQVTRSSPLKVVAISMDAREIEPWYRVDARKRLKV